MSELSKENQPNRIPENGRDAKEVLAELADRKQSDVDWRAGRSWSMVYYLDEQHLDTLKRAHELFFSENVINPFAFKSIRNLGSDLTAMTASLLNGDGATVGTLTSGGTESIFMAMYTYREHARKRRKLPGTPEIILPASSHPAFYKAAHILNLRVVEVPLTSDLRADPEAMGAAIGENTLCLVGSAPAYPFGMVDPLPEISALAVAHGLPLHVDACVGGFMLPWVEELGYPVPVWDFRLPGVTSISTDLHKFGYGEKGASIILYRSMDYLRHQFFILTDWCGGIYVSPSLTGTRSAGPIAAAWAAFQTLGREGYLEAAREVMDLSRRFRQGLAEIPEIRVLGQPHMNIVAFGTREDKPDLFVVGDELERRGWLVDRQQEPPSIHQTLMKHNGPVLDQYLEDIRGAVQFAKDHPEATAKGNAAMYGLMTRIPFRGMVEENVRKVFEDLYAPGRRKVADMEGPPVWQGWLNRLLRLLGRW